MKNWVKKSFSALISRKPPNKDRDDFIELERKIGYQFSESELLLTALTHPSYLKEKKQANREHNQRLEFLGDSVLSLILAEKLFFLYPNEREGKLAKSRSALAKGTYLTELAKELGIPKHLRMSRHEAEAGGCERASTLEDALEAIVGAIYLDSNYETSKKVVLNWYGHLEPKLKKTLKTENPKGRLQETLQSQNPKRNLQYKLLEAEGPDHQKTFKVGLYIDGEEMGTGQGLSKKEAEENAAIEALSKIKT